MIGLYLHIPYCTLRCSYCDFYLVPARGRDLGAFVAALVAEIAAVGPPFAGAAADTLHFGGGTPSLLRPDAVARLVGAVRDTFQVAPGAEIALEANPEDLDERRCAGYLAAGVNRVSVGVQAIDDRLLRLLRRPHDGAGALRALGAARRAGVPSLAADLILGLPGQGPGAALAGIERVIETGVDHLSLYLLEVHPRTRLGRRIALGREAPMEDDAAADLYERAAAVATSRGFEHYEISNFARPGHRSRHNTKYWTDGEYIGFGPAAHSYASRRRWSNAARLDEYLARGGAGIARVEDAQPPAVRAWEALFAGLRLIEGIDLEPLRRRHGDAVPGPDDPAIGELRAAGLLAGTGTRLRLTPRGRLLSNEVFERLGRGPAAAPARQLM